VVFRGRSERERPKRVTREGLSTDAEHVGGPGSSSGEVPAGAVGVGEGAGSSVVRSVSQPAMSWEELGVERAEVLDKPLIFLDRRLGGVSKGSEQTRRPGVMG